MNTAHELCHAGLNGAATGEACLQAVRRIGLRHGHLQDVLWATETLLAQQAKSKQEQARSVNDTISAVLERPRLLQEKTI